jgi:hypothetical protein
MFEFDYRKTRFAFCYLQSDRRILEKDAHELMFHAADMFFDKQIERKVKGENYEGIISRGKHRLIGTFGGLEYDCIVDVGSERTHITFLLRETLGDIELN